MEDNITLDHVSTLTEYDLEKICQSDQTLDEPADSPFELNNNTCMYYDSDAVGSTFSASHDDLGLFCLNCQGLRAHWDSFNNLLQEMGRDTHCFDVIGVTELYSMSHGECKIDGYHPLEFTTRNDTNNSRGGIGLYIRDTHKYKIRQDLSLFIPHVFESIFIELTFGGKHVIIGNIYRPNTYPQADIDIFINTMNDLQLLLAAENKDSYIMGDMNLDLLKFSNHQKTGDYLENIFTHGFLPLITKPTRLTSHSATLIDHIYTNKSDLTATSGIVVTDISDHFGIFAVIKHNKINVKTESGDKWVRSFSQSNIKCFLNLLRSSDFTSVFETNEPDMAYDIFMNLYMTVYNTAFPLKRIKIPHKYLKRSPWMTRGLVQSSLTKNKLLRKKLKKPSEANIKKLKIFCSLYNKLLRIAKASYYHEQLQSAKFNVKKTWNILRSAIDKQNHQITLPEYFKHNNMKINKHNLIADAFNKFFANIGNEISENVLPAQHEFSNYLDGGNLSSFAFVPVTPGEILDISSKIKAKNSLDCNNISTKLMKISIEQTEIAVPLTHVVNLSLSTGNVPLNMKIAKVIPIFKSGDRSLFTNYRPISILPVFSKILEKIVANKLIKFLNTYDQLYEHQYGFRSGHSTIHPVIHLMNQIAHENDKSTKNVTMSVFLDLSKAFDTISHKILIKKMENMGIRGVAKLWFESYLSNRGQFMNIGDAYSPLEPIKSGVPQGSILGPILFLLYINDIHKSTSLSVLCFADDTTVSISSNNTRELYNKINLELHSISEWLRANKLCLNTKKTKYIIFRPCINYRLADNYHVQIDDQNIERIGNNQSTKTFKFLGLNIDETISWKTHIGLLCNKISRSNYIINKVKNILPNSSLRLLYQSLIQCHVNYGLEVWGSSSSTDRLFKRLKKSIRIINRKSYNFHTEPVFKKCNTLTVKDQYQLKVATFMIQMKHHKLPNSFQKLHANYFSPTGRPTRQINVAKQTRARTRYSSLLPYHTFPKIWNELAPSFRLIESTNKFKRVLRAHLLDKYKTNVRCDNRRCRQCFPVILH